MKSDTHPTYYPEAKITCACGTTYTVGSTVEKMDVEICAACHPFYTGQDRTIDTAGRVEKFKNRTAAARPKAVKKAPVKKKETESKKTPAK